MTFEPLIRISFLTAAAQYIFWSALISLCFGIVAWLILIIGKQRENEVSSVVTIMSIVFIFTMMLVGPTMQSIQINKNEAIVSSNVSKKYQVESVTFPPKSGRGSSEDYPEQSKPQPVMIMVAGTTRPATLTQDERTSEPTLRDFDTGKPMDDILKK